MSATWDPNDNPQAPTEIQSESEIEIACAQEAYTFTNQIRKVAGIMNSVYYTIL